MHVHRQPSDIRAVHLIARGLTLVAALALAGVAGFLTALGG